MNIFNRDARDRQKDHPIMIESNLEDCFTSKKEILDTLAKKVHNWSETPRTWDPHKSMGECWALLNDLTWPGSKNPMRWLVTNHDKKGYHCCIAAPYSSSWDIMVSHKNERCAIIYAVYLMIKDLERQDY